MGKKEDQSRRYPNKHPVDPDAEKTRKRLESQTINRYLGAIQNGGPAKSMTTEQKQARLDRFDEKIDTATENEKWLIVLRLTEEKAQLYFSDPGRDLQGEFVEVALAYTQRNGISYSTWREMGVPAAALKSAGIPITRLASK